MVVVYCQLFIASAVSTQITHHSLHSKTTATLKNNYSRWYRRCPVKDEARNRRLRLCRIHQREMYRYFLYYCGKLFYDLQSA